MGWGRGCGRWKVSRHRPAGRLLTADLMQQRCGSRGQAVCLEQAPARFLHTTAKGRLAPRDPPVPQLPGSPYLQQGAVGGWHPAGTPRWSHHRLRHFDASWRCLSRAARSRGCLAWDLLGIWAPFPHPPALQVPRLQALKYLGDCSSSSQLMQRRPQTSGH